MPQEAFTDNLIESAGLQPSTSSIPQTVSNNELSTTMRSYAGIARTYVRVMRHH